MKKEILIGFLTAIVATTVGCIIFIEIFSSFNFEKSLALIDEGKLYGRVLVLGATANFFVFYIFLKKKQIYRVRGVVLESFVIAFIVLLLTFFIKK